MFDGRNACGGDDWQVDDVPDNNRNSTSITIIATHLKSDTLYAYYIQTNTVAGEQRGGISPIKYFRTAPERITDMLATADDSSKIVGQENKK